MKPSRHKLNRNRFYRAMDTYLMVVKDEIEIVDKSEIVLDLQNWTGFFKGFSSSNFSFGCWGVGIDSSILSELFNDIRDCRRSKGDFSLSDEI